jgi:hypothetical protein
LNFDLPPLGWFNDGHFTLHENINMCFTYICKLSCNIASWKCSHYLMSYYLDYLCSTLHVQYERCVQTDDIYIYHAHTLSLLLACLQNKQRRGRLSFKEREDDVDMTISDTTKITTREYIYQVNSSTNIRIYYFIIQIKDTTLYFILYRFTEDLYTPRVKMRVQIKIISHECIRTLLAVHDFPSIKMHACSCTSHFKKTRETSVCLMYIKKRREAKIGPCYTKLHVNGQWSRTRPKALLVHRSRSRALDRLEAKRYRNLIERRRVRFC